MKKKKNKNKKLKRAIKPKRQIKKKTAKIKKRKTAKLKTKKRAVLKNKKKTKTKKRKIKKSKKKRLTPFTLGNINPSRGRILALIISIVFMATGMIFANILKNKNEQAGQVAGALVQSVQVAAKKNVKLEKEIKQMVQGYPIEKMTPYIVTQDPKTAAFLIAIAKKESDWGKHKPVLNGQDCYNYWGFRLKAERMGSNGHTCFDSPKEAVEKVASRIDEMVKEENVDSAKDMIVWKCGYGCKGEEKSKSELKWIKDVNYYYSEFSDYL